ncbi:MAG TPA: hypothetical protein PK405_00185 [Hyphomicrobiales bacterium]|mgnify:CR=1 FL=1|nr:hypothetical protein [Rhodobiaceae bacterium]HXK53081.1 hypothetical protein [Hyphomicrobiales bacterium]
MSSRHLPTNRTPRAQDASGADVYFERTQIGIYAKVAAIDAATRVEVTVMGPASANPRTLEQAALRKLNARLRRDR